MDAGWKSSSFTSKLEHTNASESACMTHLQADPCFFIYLFFFKFKEHFLLNESQE